MWHILTKEAADRYAEPARVAKMLYSHAYRVGAKNLPDGLTVRQYVRVQLDRLGIGEQVTEFYMGSRRVTLPPVDLPG